MAGAPRGRFPGGISNIPYNMSLEFNRTGLVYQCKLSAGNCTGLLGNGNSTTPDGMLFDRVGKRWTMVELL